MCALSKIELMIYFLKCNSPIFYFSYVIKWQQDKLLKPESRKSSLILLPSLSPTYNQQVFPVDSTPEYLHSCLHFYCSYPSLKYHHLLSGLLYWGVASLTAYLSSPLLAINPFFALYSDIQNVIPIMLINCLSF